MNFIMFCLGAFSLAIGMVAQPYVMMVLNVFKSRKKREKNTHTTYTIEDKLMIGNMLNRIDDLETQVNNVAERLSTRDRNRKHNIRRDVRDYLAELRDEK